jgi:MFS family permease
MTRRGLLASALGAGVSLSNFAVALPLLVLARGDSPRQAGALIGLETIAFSFGALLPLRFRRSAAPIAIALGLVAIGDLVLAVPSGQLLLALGALIHGSGMGLFWVGVQASLGRRSGASGSERAFVAQYTLYVAGTASGGALTGAAIAALRAFGVDHVASIRLTFLIGAAAVVGALPVVLAWLRGLEPGTPIRLVAPRALYGLRLQLPDLLLVSAMGPLLGHAPVVPVSYTQQTLPTKG